MWKILGKAFDEWDSLNLLHGKFLEMFNKHLFYKEMIGRLYNRQVAFG